MSAELDLDRPLTAADFDQRRPLKSREQPKLCPTCWNVMRQVGNRWECPKHGAPGPTPIDQPRRRDRRARPQFDRIERLGPSIVERNQAGESVAAIAESVWQELGYAN